MEHQIPRKAPVRLTFLMRWPWIAHAPWPPHLAGRIRGASEGYREHFTATRIRDLRPFETDAELCGSVRCGVVLIHRPPRLSPSATPRDRILFIVTNAVREVLWHLPPVSEFRNSTTFALSLLAKANAQLHVRHDFYGVRKLSDGPSWK